MLVLLLASLPAAAAPQAEVYRARSRPAAELLPLAETALAGEGRAVLDESTNALVLVGPPEAVARALALLRSQDVPLPTVLLQYEMQRSRDLSSRGIRVDWSAGAGSFRVGNVVLPGGASGVAVRPGGGELEAEEGLRGRLRVLSGHTGRITTGQDVPVTTVQRNRYRVTETTTLVPADSGFEVRPRVLGDGRVHLELHPFSARPLPGGAVARSGATTTIVVTPGTTVAVGGIGQSRDVQRREPLRGSRDTRGSDERLLLIRVDVETPPAD